MSKMATAGGCFKYLILFLFTTHYQYNSLPIVVNTWPFVNATQVAWKTITMSNMTAIDAVERGCSVCEILRCDGSVGWGGSPDELGETTLDAMIMDGITHNVGSVGAIRHVKTAISVARAVMERSSHTLLVGEQATLFAQQLGFTIEDTHSVESVNMYQDWRKTNCQPNYWENVVPDPSKFCGPYKPMPFTDNQQLKWKPYDKNVGFGNHDTIGMIVIDHNGNVAAGTTTNGMNHKIPGRVGDSPIAGAGSYVNNEVGGAAATGDGDIMMRFLPSYYAVMLMKTGVAPGIATAEAIKEIIKFYPKFAGAVLAVNVHGEHGAACHGFDKFPYSIRTPDYTDVTVLYVPCI